MARLYIRLQSRLSRRAMARYERYELNAQTADMWAFGFITYEVLTGKHPLWVKGDEKLEYKEKLKKQTPINYNNKRLTP